MWTSLRTQPKGRGTQARGSWALPHFSRMTNFSSSKTYLLGKISALTVMFILIDMLYPSPGVLCPIQHRKPILCLNMRVPRAPSQVGQFPLQWLAQGNGSNYTACLAWHWTEHSETPFALAVPEDSTIPAPQIKVRERVLPDPAKLDGKWPFRKGPFLGWQRMEGKLPWLPSL